MDPTWIVRLDAPGDGPRLAVKDCMDIEGLPTTVGCQAIAEQASPAARDAAVVAAARRAGARIVGKTNLCELCWSASGVNPWSGTPVNPADPRRVPGGSSSGSAVAVAAGEADVALGTDTGGSVRIPAACCGIAGLKTTWGRVPVDGVYPLAPSLDTVGPLGLDVAAVELGMRLIEPGFTAGSCELSVGRIRPEATWTRRSTPRWTPRWARLACGSPALPGSISVPRTAGDVLIDVEGYRANAHLIPQLDRLSPQMRRNMTEAAAITLISWTPPAGPGRGAGLVRGHAGPPSVPGPADADGPAAAARRTWHVAHHTDHAGQPGRPAGAGPALGPIPGPVRGGPAGPPASLQLIGPPGGEEQLIALGRVVEAALR